MARKAATGRQGQDHGTHDRGKGFPRRACAAAAVLGAVLLACAPAQALAAEEPILSGYGGPGQGSQVLLGAEVLPEGGSAASPPASIASPPAATGAARAGAGRRAGSHRSGPAPAAPRSAGAAGRPPAADRLTVAAVQPQNLGLTGSDVAVILGAIAALVATAALTRQLGRRGDG